MDKKDQESEDSKKIKSFKNENDLLKQISQDYTKNTTVQTEKIKYKAGLLKFASLYSTKKIAIRYLIILAFSLLTGLLGMLLVQNTGIYSPGVAGLSQGLGRFVQSILISNQTDTQQAKIAYDVIFWLLVILINIPLLVFAYFKIGKHFALMTLVYIVSSQIFGFIISQIPNSESVMIFGDNKLTYPSIDDFFNNGILTKNVSQGLNSNILSFESISNPNIRLEFKEFYDKNPNITIESYFSNPKFNSSDYKEALYDFSKPFYSYHDLISNKVQILPWTDPNQASKIPSIMVYAIIYSIFDGIFLAIVYIIGGSSGGTDVASFWYSKKYGKPIGSILTYFNVITLILGIILGSFIPAGMVNSKFWDAQLFFSPNMIASVLASIILGIVLNIYFPKHKSLKIQVYSKNINAIVEHLYVHDFNNSITISSSSENLSSLKINQSFQTISPYIELPSLIRLIREVDKSCLIIIHPIVDIDGEIVLRKSLS